MANCAERLVMATTRQVKVRNTSKLDYLSVLKEEENPKKVVITESPIDALSYKQQYEEKDTVYISTCGNLTRRLKKEIGKILKGAKASGQDVVLAFDKDEAGRN